MKKRHTMTQFLQFIILLFSLNLMAQDVNWLTLNEALARQQKEPRKIIMEFYTNWCGPCKLLEKRTFNNKDVVSFINTHFYAVKFNAEGNEAVTFKGKEFKNKYFNSSKVNRRNATHSLTRFFGVAGYPSVAFLDENADLITLHQGFLTPKQIEIYLKLFYLDEYKNLKSQEEADAYFKHFKHEFKG